MPAIDVGIAVTDLQTGQTVSVNGNVAHKTGCVINLYRAARRGRPSSRPATPAHPGLEYSIKEGIGGSHPPEVKSFIAGDLRLLPEAGVERARQLMAALGPEGGGLRPYPLLRRRTTRRLTS